MGHGTRHSTMTLPQPKDLRAARLADLGGLWLNLSGCCRRTSLYPLTLMAQQQGGERLLGDVLPRLRCSACGHKPVRILLVDRADDSPHGAQATLKIDLSAD
jgi:hypothetical protein